MTANVMTCPHCHGDVPDDELLARKIDTLEAAVLRTRTRLQRLELQLLGAPPAQSRPTLRLLIDGAVTATSDSDGMVEE